MAYGDVSPAPTPDVLPVEQQRKVLLADDPWSDERALAIVRSDFAYAESFRTHAHDWRYRNADELYLAWAGQRYWDGTRVPRSSIGIYVVFEQVEAMLPKIVGAVTGTDGYHFTADQPGDKDTDLIIQAHKELVVAQLEETNFREQVRRAVKSLEIYGNGILEVGYEDYEDEYISFEKKTVPTGFSLVPHPLGLVKVPSGTKEDFTRKIKRETKSRPYVRYVSIKDFYVDPNCESSRLQDAGYVIKRVYMRAEQIKALKDQPGFNIPSDDILTKFSMSKVTANQDVTKQSAELFRYNLWNPSQDYTSDPSQKRIEVIEYTAPSRKIWLLGREHVAYNQRNRYGMINFFSGCYADVPDRWHALSVSDVGEGEQRLQQAIINARVDEVSLSIHPPMNKRRGVTIPGYQLKIRPGVVREMENPAEDLVQQKIQDITQSAYIEVEASERRVQRITGMSDLAALGSPSAGGNSANRTATGVNTQVGATEGRVKYLVENVEDQLIEPVVNAVIKFNRKFLDLKSAANWLKLDPRFKSLDPEKVMNTRVSAECRGSIKMAARNGFLNLFPMLSQVYINPETMQFLAKQKKKFNMEEWMRMSMDAINYSPRNPLIVDLTEEELQSMNQPPAEAVMKAQLQQGQIQSDENINNKRLLFKLIGDFITKGMDTHAKHAELDDRHIQTLLQIAADLKSGEDDSGGAGKDSKSGK